jgi:nucleoside phosphorylase
MYEAHRVPVKNMKVVGICAALRWELASLLSELGASTRSTIDGGPVWLTKDPNPLCAFITGIGPEHAKRRLESLMAALDFEVLINIGCAGGLVSEASAGALIIADRIEWVSWTGVRSAQTDPLWRNRLEQTARSADLAPRIGTIFSSPTPLVGSRERSNAHDLHEAVAVEMEGSAIAEAAAAHQIPFASARVILDTVEITCGEKVRYALRTTLSKGESRDALRRRTTSAVSAPRLAAAADAVEQTLHHFLTAFLRSLRSQAAV